MRKVLLVASILGFIAVAAPATAIDFGGTTVVIPVVMHGPGKLGTAWVTDVWVANHSSLEKTVTLDFYPTGGGHLTSTVQIGIWGAVELEDIVLQTFSLDNAKGMLILSVEGGSQFNAQARIYNTGNTIGEFGQFVPGFDVKDLKRQAWSFGLSGVSGNRTNVGVANPTDKTFEVTVTLTDGDHTTQTGKSFTLSPKQLVQIDDIFAYLNVTPADNMQVEFISAVSDELIYGYASVVRGDTGDAIFIPGMGPNY